MSLPILVLKFGGSSVATAEKMGAVARRVARFRRQGYHVAVVVSARGDTTDELIAAAKALGPQRPDGRELDQLLATGEQQSIALLALALGREGLLARSLTGAQWGLRAEGRPGMGVVTGCDPSPVHGAFAEGAVVVAAGFQAKDPKGDVITLGRGGSDLSAIALAGALGAKSCNIFTDVTGLFSADPRIVPGARKVAELSAELCLELTAAGAKVLQSRCVELACRLDVPLYLAHSTLEEGGSWVMNDVKEQAAVVALTDQPGWCCCCARTPAFEAFSKFLSAATEEGVAPLEFAARGDEIWDVWCLADSLPQALDAAARWGVTLTPDEERYTKLTVVGPGLGNHGELCSFLPLLLAEGGIRPCRLTVGGNALALWVPARQGEDGLRLLHRRLIEEPFFLKPCPAPSL